ncbi:G0/G1 switch protein 2 [Lepisosteus oculatus]|uniref:G0/G1 switch 2 n=1 Tax=Lepisosteus oculatus TaxID=7918 RepID=W5NN31_LEPOC|nr:PREDICTED: G0/G1 switch protein 2 [Lepisosteus oculatus]
METMQELIPFAKEMLSQKPSRKMVRVYLVGSVLAFFGVVIGLVETVCQPFSSDAGVDEEIQRLAERERRALEAEERREMEEIATSENDRVVKPKRQVITGQRNAANRLHAS